MIGSLFNAFTLLGSEWVLWVLVILSIISTAMIIERFRNLSAQERVGARLWKEKLEAAMKSGKVSELSGSALASNYPCLESAVVELLASEGKGRSKSGREELEMLTAGFLGRKKLELERNLAFLGTVGSNAPFIGLFGTVLGIIKAFHDMGSKVESAGAQVISVGISEALVATAVGLLVAIPAVVFYNYFQRKIRMIMGRAESLSQILLSEKGN